MDTEVPHRSRRDLAAWLAEAVYVTDVLLVSLAAFLILVSGKDPFHSVAGATFTGACALVIALRHVWGYRHRDEQALAIARHTARERRGF